MDGKPPNRECKFVTKVHVNPSRTSRVIGTTQVGEQFYCGGVRMVDREVWIKFGNIGWMLKKAGGTVETTREIG